MQIDIRFPAELYEKLKRHLFPVQTGVQPEQIAFCYAGSARRGDGTLLTVREVLPVPTEFIEFQDFDGIELADSFKVQAVLRARDSGLTLIEVHSHPHPVCDRNVAFSEFDKKGQALFHRYLSWKIPGRDWVALVFGCDSVAGTYWSADRIEPLPVSEIRIVGPRIERREGSSTDGRGELTRYQRQTMAYGVQSQRLLGQMPCRNCRFGRLGSAIAQQLAYLGVRNLVLVDGDVVEATNLNRLIGVGESDVGAFKTAAISDHLRRISSRLNAITVPQDVRSPEALNALKGCDVLVGAVDNDGVRAVLAEFAAAYLMPYFDAASDVIPPRRTFGGRSRRPSFYMVARQSMPVLCGRTGPQRSEENAVFAVRGDDRQSVGLRRRG